MKKRKISVDFDSTLSEPNVQKLIYELQLLHSDLEVHIVTSRQEDSRNPSGKWNADLYIVANQLDIPMERIHFCNLTPKYKFFKENPDFILHLDDDIEEVEDIQSNTTVNAILYVPTFSNAVETIVRSSLC
jgi:hypothetical protein